MLVGLLVGFSQSEGQGDSIDPGVSLSSLTPSCSPLSPLPCIECKPQHRQMKTAHSAFPFLLQHSHSQSHDIKWPKGGNTDVDHSSTYKMHAHSTRLYSPEASPYTHSQPDCASSFQQVAGHRTSLLSWAKHALVFLLCFFYFSSSHCLTGKGYLDFTAHCWVLMFSQKTALSQHSLHPSGCSVFKI